MKYWDMNPHLDSSSALSLMKKSDLETKRKEYLESIFFFLIVYNIDTYILHNTIHLKKLC